MAPKKATKKTTTKKSAKKDLLNTQTLESADHSPSANIIPSAVSSRNPSYEEIAVRAYYISLENSQSTPEENWYRAERELRAGL